jgi:hypothetical protein
VVPDWAGFEQAVFAMQRLPSFQTMALKVLGANRVGHYGTAKLRQSGVGGKHSPRAIQLLMRVIRGPLGAMSLKDSLIRDTMAVPVVAALLIMTLHATTGVFPGATQAAEAAGWAGTTTSAMLSDYADEIGDRLRATQSAAALVADPSDKLCARMIVAKSVCFSLGLRLEVPNHRQSRIWPPPSPRLWLASRGTRARC